MSASRMLQFETEGNADGGRFCYTFEDFGVLEDFRVLGPREHNAYVERRRTTGRRIPGVYSAITVGRWQLDLGCQAPNPLLSLNISLIIRRSVDSQAKHSMFTTHW